MVIAVRVEQPRVDGCYVPLGLVHVVQVHVPLEGFHYSLPLTVHQVGLCMTTNAEDMLTILRPTNLHDRLPLKGLNHSEAVHSLIHSSEIPKPSLVVVPSRT